MAPTKPETPIKKGAGTRATNPIDLTEDTPSPPTATAAATNTGTGTGANTNTVGAGAGAGTGAGGGVLSGRVAKSTPANPDNRKNNAAATPKKGKMGGPACQNCRKAKVRCEWVVACLRCLRAGVECLSADGADEAAGILKACQRCRRMKTGCVRKDSCEKCEKKGVKCVYA